jgi:hypothetical protein
MKGRTSAKKQNGDAATDEASEPKKGRRSRYHRIKDMVPDFIGKHELARHLCVSTGTIDNWIYSGSIPAPHSRPSDRHPVWLRRHYNIYRDSGVWPKEAYRR